MAKIVLGLDLGSNSIGWALTEELDGKASRLIDLGSRIFIKAVEDKTPTPKNHKRREKRLARRVIQRRARRKSRMLNYLVSLGLLPKELQGNQQPEIILNQLGDPYALRAKALDQVLVPYELGRVFLHLVQRRGFLSNRKILLGDMVDDPDVIEIMEESGALSEKKGDAEETAFLSDISELRACIEEDGCRTLGEYLSGFSNQEVKRNRVRDGGHLRTDRQMYRDEFELIYASQSKGHAQLTLLVKEELEDIIFKQRPLKLKADRVGKCSLEPQRKRSRIARLEFQRFRYLQDINHFEYFDVYEETWRRLTDADRQKLIGLFEATPAPTFPKIRKELGFDRKTEFNLEQGTKKLKGNVTACEIRNVFSGWDQLSRTDQIKLVEDLITIQKKSVLKKRLMSHWAMDTSLAVSLCLLEFEPGQGNHSLKAINAMLPHLEKGQIYSDARISAGYGYEVDVVTSIDKLGPPSVIANPIAQKGLHELRRLVNAVIAEYGKPDAIRIEMARDLEMNTKRYKDFIKQQKRNTQANEEATGKYQEIAKLSPHLNLAKYPSRADKIKYRLWCDQDQMCAYSGRAISLSTLFSAEIDVDHVVPYSRSLDDSYMNKVVCYASENRYKGQRTPIDAFESDAEKWEQITARIHSWSKTLRSKTKRFFRTEADLAEESECVSSQLNDTRYISKLALGYLKQLGVDVSVSKGITTSWFRKQWGLNTVLSQNDVKNRHDHMHHAIDALIVACVNRSLYQNVVKLAKELERKRYEIQLRDIHIDPPWDSLCEDVGAMISNKLVSFPSQKKLQGALHEDTGVGFIDGVGTVYRKNLGPEFKAADCKKIIDKSVRSIVQNHLERFGGSSKLAFAPDNPVMHKDGKTPIKRVRVRQSSATRKKLEMTKLGIKARDGKVFKWMAYGNIHHVEVLKNKKDGKYTGRIVTMFEAKRRAMSRCKPLQTKGSKAEPIVERDHGNAEEFIFALHINDTVTLKQNGEDQYYRIKKLGQLDSGQQPRLTLTPLRVSGTSDFDLSNSVSNLITRFQMTPHRVNVLGYKLS